MNINQILDCEEARCIEPSFADLTEDIYTDMLLSSDAQYGRLLVDEHETPIALALGNGSLWTIGNFLFRQPTVRALERFEALAGDIYQESREHWIYAVRRYYSNEILTNVNPAIEDVSIDRFTILQDVLESIWGSSLSGACIECCCGSGIGAAVLRSLGMRPIAYDNDPSLLSLGLLKGRLAPDETMCIDGTRASSYCSYVPRGASFMFGEIYAFNEDMWHQIVHELVALTGESIITVGAEREAMLIEEWAQLEACNCRITENKADPIYDRWVCHITRR